MIFIIINPGLDHPMSWIALGCAALAALCLYLSSRHQSLWLAATRLAGPLRLGAALSISAAWLLAGREYGIWCGLFIVLATCMLPLALLPYLDAWRRNIKGRRHVV